MITIFHCYLNSTNSLGVRITLYKEEHKYTAEWNEISQTTLDQLEFWNTIIRLSYSTLFITHLWSSADETFPSFLSRGFA